MADDENPVTDASPGRLAGDALAELASHLSDFRWLQAQRLIALRPSLKVLFTSGCTADIIVQHGVLRGESGFLVQPYSLDQLARRVRDVLGAPGAEA